MARNYSNLPLQGEDDLSEREITTDEGHLQPSPLHTTGNTPTESTTAASYKNMSFVNGLPGSLSALFAEESSDVIEDLSLDPSETEQTSQYTVSLASTTHSKNSRLKRGEISRFACWKLISRFGW